MTPPEVIVEMIPNAISPTPNVPLLRKVVEWVEAEEAKPEEQREWYQPSYFVRRSHFDCETVCCVAGKIALDEGWVPRFGIGHLTSVCEKDGVVTLASEVARNALGLDEYQSYNLFHGGNTASRVRRLAEEYAGERL